VVRPHGANGKSANGTHKGPICWRTAGPLCWPLKGSYIFQGGSLRGHGWPLMGPLYMSPSLYTLQGGSLQGHCWPLMQPVCRPQSLYDLRTHYRSKVTTITLSGHTQITHYFQLKLVNVGSCKCDWRVKVSTGTYNRSIMHMFSSGKSTVNVAFNVVHTGAITKLCFGNI